jgi:uncharacterized membrane protein YeiH
LIYQLDLIGTAVFASAGVLSAGGKRMDLFGVVVVARVSALGGGTLRDVILNANPVFWVSDPLYLYVAGLAALGTFYAATHVSRIPPGIFLVADAMGLAVFTIIGANKAFDFGAPYIVVVIMGIMTGVAGGIMRDMLCAEIPLVLRREIYATACLVGGVMFVVLAHLHAPPSLLIPLPAATVLAVRLAAIYWQLSLPVFDDEYPED